MAHISIYKDAQGTCIIIITPALAPQPSGAQCI